MGKLMVGLRRFLLLCAVVLLLLTMMLLDRAFAQQVTVTINPTQGPPGTSVTGAGSIVNLGYGQPGDRIRVIWDDASQTVLANTNVLSDYTFSVSFNVPANATAGAHTIRFIEVDLGTGYVLGAPIFTVGQGTGTSIILERVLTYNGEGNEQTQFAPGDDIRYGSIVTNTGSSAVTAKFTFLATGPAQIFSFISTDSYVSPGRQVIYASSSIPNAAPAGNYTLRVTITYNGQFTTKESLFTVTALPQAPPRVALSLNQTTFHSGETLHVGLQAANPGQSFNADFYFGYLLPDGVTAVFLTSLAPLNSGRVRVDGNPQAFKPLAANVLIPQGLNVAFNDVFMSTFSGSDPTGTYVFFAFFTPPGAFNDGRVDPGDILASDSKAFTVLAAAQEPGALFIDRVWTTDGDGNDKTTFMPGDAVRYTTIIRNTYNHPVAMQISFEAAGPSWAIRGQQNPAFRIIYRYTQDNVTVPAGRAGYYSPWEIPINAQPGLYYLLVRIRWVNDNGSTGYREETGEFYVPGFLATSVTTFLSDGVTPTSATVEAEPGGALLYKITVTNTSYPSVQNTGVILTDPLPPEIFAIIGTATTDHGTCGTIGSWPSTTLSCLLSILAPGETATIYFTASIIVRNPDGTPRPPKNFVNTVSVWSDQQSRATSASVETLATVDVLSDDDYNKVVNAVENYISFVPVVGTLADFVWKLIGRDIESGKPKPFREKLIVAINLGSQELLKTVLNELGHVVGLGDSVGSNLTDVCTLACWTFFPNTR